MLQIEVKAAADLSEGLRRDIVSLCDRAYREPTSSYLEAFLSPTHVLATFNGVLVAHALWVTRWLQAASGPLMRTAYVELVATDPDYQHRGYASAVMLRVAASITDYDLGALCPSDAGRPLYKNLGWQTWRGPLGIRAAQGLIATPDELVMVYMLPRTPALDLDAMLTAEWRPGELW